MTLPFKPRVVGLRGWELETAAAPVKVDLNENPYDFPEALKEEVWRRVRDRPWSRYPAHPSAELRDAIAKVEGVAPGGVLCANGSQELIHAILSVTLEPGAALLVPRPSFPVYGALGMIATDRIDTFDLGPDLGYDHEATLAAVARSSARVVVLCSPNNPTGSVVSEELARAVLLLPDRLVVIDEAYHEFAASNLRALLEPHENLVILRTFSKAWRLAGMRIGYLLGHEHVVREIAKAVLPFSVNVFSEACALVALAHRLELAGAVSAICRARGELFQSLAATPGVRPYPSAANFILFEVDAEPRVIWAKLRDRGVMVRDVSRAHLLSKALRVTVGTDAENAAFLAALRDALPR